MLKSSPKPPMTAEQAGLMAKITSGSLTDSEESWAIKELVRLERIRQGIKL